MLDHAPDRRIAAVVIAGLLAIGVLGSWAIAVSAVEVQSCSQARYVAYENNGSGDALQVCYPTNLPNLYNVLHTQAGWCNAIVQDAHDDWNDCISYIANYTGSETTHRVCAYTGANYSGSRVIIYPNTFASWLWPHTFADSISSIKWDC